MKLFSAKRLWLTFISLLMVGNVIASACSSEQRVAASAAPAPTIEPTPQTCERAIFDIEPIEDSLSWPSEECYFYFYATVGDIVSITMHSMDGDFDPYLELYDPADTLLTANDDDDYSLDSRIAEQRLPADGQYTIVASSYEYSGSGRFHLELTREGGSTGPTAKECGNIAYGQTRVGVLSWSGEECYYRFHATGGDTVTIAMHSINEDLDPYLKLYDPYDSLLMENDDDSFSLDSRVSEQILSLDGWYTIIAQSYNNESFGRFELTLTKTEIVSVSRPPNQSECGRMIDYEELVLDTITWPGEECHFRFLATANDKVTILMRSIDEELDPCFKLYDPYDLLLIANDDPSFGLDSRIYGQTLPLNGRYTIVAKSCNNVSFGRFELTLTIMEWAEG